MSWACAEGALRSATSVVVFPIAAQTVPALPSVNCELLVASYQRVFGGLNIAWLQLDKLESGDFQNPSKYAFWRSPR